MGRRQPSGIGAGVDAFIRHTCLSLICRLMAYRFLTPRSSERDLWSALSGDYFAGEGLGNFLGEDFFSWPFFRLSMGVSDDAAAMDMARSLMAALELFDFDQPPPDYCPPFTGIIRERWISPSPLTSPSKEKEE